MAGTLFSFALPYLNGLLPGWQIIISFVSMTVFLGALIGSWRIFMIEKELDFIIAANDANMAVDKVLGRQNLWLMPKMGDPYKKGNTVKCSTQKEVLIILGDRVDGVALFCLGLLPVFLAANILNRDGYIFRG